MPLPSNGLMARVCVSCGETYQPTGLAQRSCTNTCLRSHPNRPKAERSQAAALTRWADPDFRARTTASIRRSWESDPERGVAQGAAISKWHAARRESTRVLREAKQAAGAALIAARRENRQSRIERTIALYRSGLSELQVGRVMGVSESGVSRILGRHGVATRWPVQRDLPPGSWDLVIETSTWSGWRLRKR